MKHTFTHFQGRCKLGRFKISRLVERVIIGFGVFDKLLVSSPIFVLCFQLTVYDPAQIFAEFLDCFLELRYKVVDANIHQLLHSFVLVRIVLYHRAARSCRRIYRGLHGH